MLLTKNHESVDIIANNDFDKDDNKQDKWTFKGYFKYPKPGKTF